MNIITKTLTPNELEVKLEKCSTSDSSQIWQYTNNWQLRHVSSGKCLDLLIGLKRQTAKLTFVSQCHVYPYQQWEFKTKAEFTLT